MSDSLKPLPSLFTREMVAARFAVPPKLLIRYERYGLVHATTRGAEEGYEPAEIRRIWTVISLQRDLGINLAGVEAVIKLKRHLDEIHEQLDQLARKLRETVDNGIDDAAG
jgi:MerR family transcriptional regulator/heat shock protein HspR